MLGNLDERLKNRGDKVKKKINISLHLHNLMIRTISIFSILFTIILGVIALVQLYIFDQHSINIIEIFLIGLITFIISLLLSLFYQINKITVFIQIITTYIILIIFLYFLGFASNWFSFKDISFLIISLSFNFVGIIILSIIIFVNRYKEIRDLNRDLSHYKGRDRR